MLNKVNFQTESNDTKVYSVSIELSHRGKIEDRLKVLADFQKRYTNESCVYSSTIRNFKPVLAVFYPTVWGWTSGFEIRFFDESMLDNAGIEHGFSAEPRGEFGHYNRTVYDLKKNEMKAYKLD